MLSLAAPAESAWLSPTVAQRDARAVPGHNRWHPDIPAVAEVISGGSVRMECQSRWDLDPRDPYADAILCGPLSVVGAEPGDVIVVAVLALGRSDGRYAAAAHPGILGCAPGAETLPPAGSDYEGVLLGYVRPGLAAYEPVAARALRSAARGHEIDGCDVVRLTAGSQIMLPVHAHGAKLSVGDLHFPDRRTEDCLDSARAGWIDLRINLTKRGVERFRITAPRLMPLSPSAASSRVSR